MPLASILSSQYPRFTTVRGFGTMIFVLMSLLWHNLQNLFVMGRSRLKSKRNQVSTGTNDTIFSTCHCIKQIILEMKKHIPLLIKSTVEQLHHFPRVLLIVVHNIQMDLSTSKGYSLHEAEHRRKLSVNHNNFNQTCLMTQKLKLIHLPTTYIPHKERPC